MDNDPTDEEYRKHEILGWTGHMSSEDMSDRPEKAKAMLWMMRSKLSRLVEVLSMVGTYFLGSYQTIPTT